MANQLTASCPFPKPMLDFGCGQCEFGARLSVDYPVYHRNNLCFFKQHGNFNYCAPGFGNGFRRFPCPASDRSYCDQRNHVDQGRVHSGNQDSRRHLRYMRLYYTVGTENFSAGKLTAWIDIGSGEGDS